tara:strand:+ start:208 stop:447 length:240 start_codon:yes stop_codon:yes gene_type:complete
MIRYFHYHPSTDYWPGVVSYDTIAEVVEVLSYNSTIAEADKKVCELGIKPNWCETDFDGKEVYEIDEKDIKSIIFADSL